MLAFGLQSFAGRGSVPWVEQPRQGWVMGCLSELIEDLQASASSACPRQCLFSTDRTSGSPHRETLDKAVKKLEVIYLYFLLFCQRI